MSNMSDGTEIVQLPCVFMGSIVRTQNIVNILMISPVIDVSKCMTTQSFLIISPL